jgi:peptidoglycan-associated lipoprotein
MRINLIGVFIVAIMLWACGLPVPIRDGATAMDRKQYAVAIKLQNKEYPKAKTQKEKGQIAWRQGEAHRTLGQFSEAARWYKLAADQGYGPEAFRRYAELLKSNGDYQASIQAYKDLGTELGSQYEVKREIVQCQTAQQWQRSKDSSGYKLTPLDFNTSGAEYAPTAYLNGQIVFTSDRDAGKKTYNWSGGGFHDLWTIGSDGGKPIRLEGGVNTDKNEGTLVVNATGTEAYFTRCEGYEKEDFICRLYEITRLGEGWTNPESLPLFETPGVNYGQPALHPDGQSLVLSAESPDGWGGHDLYICLKGRENQWSEPQLLPRSINTVGDEMFPSFDGDTLYFSSSGLVGMGGLDLFKTWKSNGNWVPPLNLRAPMNSGADDFGILILAHNQADVWQKGWVTSNRAGSDDIFEFEQRAPILPPPPPVIPNAPPVKPGRLLLQVQVVEKAFLDPTDPSSRFLGYKPLGGASLKGNDENAIITISEPYETLLKPDKSYTFAATKTGYLTHTEVFKSDGLVTDPKGADQVFELQIVLDKIYFNKEISLENIYYDYNRKEIRPDARPTLDALALMLTNNPTVKIRLSSHTDCRGTTEYNQELSQGRAESAVQYLISAGIAPERLTAAGLGENSPAIACGCSQCTEPEHQANRRTTFTILE